MRLCICNELFDGWRWERLCDFVREIGYEGIEVAPFTLGERAEEVSAARRHELREAAESRGLQIVGLHWLLVKPTGIHLTHPDAQIRKRTADYLCELVSLCADLGGQVMVIGSPQQRNLLPGVGREQAIDHMHDVLRQALEVAAMRRVTLAIEPLSPRETDFIQTAAEGIELVEKIDHPNFRLHLDVKAMSAEDRPMPEIILASARYLAHFHVNDPNLLGPGMGRVKFEPIVAALRQAGYSGWLSVEAFDFQAGAERIARESMAYMRSVLAR